MIDANTAYGILVVVLEDDWDLVRFVFVPSFCT